MNPRKARGVIFILVAVLTGLVVVVLLADYVSGVRDQVGAEVTVFRAANDLPAYTLLTADDVTSTQVPARWVDSTAVKNRQDLVGRRLAVSVAQGETMTGPLLLDASSLSSDEREIALEVDAVSGVAGRVEPGATVDVYAVFADVPGLPKQVRVLVRDARVVSVGGSEVHQDPTDLSKQNTVLPVTLALHQTDAMSVIYASAFASSVRLVGLPLVGSQDRSGEIDNFNAANLGGTAVPNGGN